MTAPVLAELSYWQQSILRSIGVLVAVLVGGFHVQRPKTPHLSGTAGTIAVLVIVLLISIFLARVARQRDVAAE